MKRKFINALLFCGLVAGTAVTLASCEDYDDDIDSLQAQIDANTATIEDLTDSQVSTITSSISSLESAQSSLESTISSVETTLSSSIEDNTEAIETVQSNLSTLESAQSELSSEISSIETTLSAAIDSNTDAVEDLQEELASLQASLTSVNSAIETLEAALETKASTDDLIALEAEFETAIATANAAIAEAQAAAEEAAASAQAAADNAQAAADLAQSAADAAQATADGAQSSADAAQAAAEVAQSTADAAQAAAEAAQATADVNAATLETIVTSLATVQETIESEIAVLSEELTEAIASIAENKAEVEASLAETNSLIATNTTRIEALEGVDSELAAEIEATNTELESLSSQLAALETQLAATLETAYAYTDAQVAILSASIEDVEAELASASVTIAANSTYISELQSSLSSLTTELADLESSVNTSIDAYSETMTILWAWYETMNGTAEDGETESYATSSTVAELQERVDALEEELNNFSLEGTGYSSLSDVIAAISENASDIDNLETSLAEVESSLESLKELLGIYAYSEETSDTYYSSIINTIEATIEQMNGSWSYEQYNEDGTIDTIDVEQKSLYELYTMIVENQANIESILSELTAINDGGKLLKSLIFSPECYYEGIEAIKMSYYSYEALSLSTADKTTNQSTDAATATGETKTVAPAVTAKYYANPSNADIDFDELDNFGFIGNTAEYITRSFDAANNINITKVYQEDASTGKFAVEFSVVNASEISDLSTSDYVDVVALQYTYSTENEDTTVTSDFAALYKEEVSEFYINKTDSAMVDDTSKPDAHLATTAAEAISDYTSGTLSYPVIYLPYTWEDGIDLDDYINVHKTSNDDLWGGQETINKEYFSLVYELIGYIVDDSDGTSESEHATIDGTQLTIHGVGEAYDASSARKLIGRTPLVRVSLKDNSNNAIAAVGYIIVEISEVVTPEAEPSYITLEMDPVTDDYTIVCNDATVYDGAATTWLAIENELLGQLNMSKSQFESIYSLYDVDGSTYDTYGATQFDDEMNELSTDKYVGEVIFTDHIDTEEYETSILEWVIGNEFAYDAFVEQELTSVSTWVMFEPSSSAYNVIYIKLTWAPANLPVEDVTATIEDSDKKTADWHKDNSREAGYYDVHFQVGAATDPSATADYDPLTLNTVFTSTPSEIVAEAISTSGYTELAVNLVTYYRFAKYDDQDVKTYTGVSGVAYTTVVANDGLTISAGATTDGTYTETTLATIGAEDGTVTLDENDVLKDILNSPKYGDYADALTFTIEIYAETCDPAGEDLVEIENSQFDVIVVKPLYIENCTVDGMQWNNYSTLTQDITVGSVMDFNGYDPDTFYENSKYSITLFDFYGVSGIEVDTDEATTNYSGTWAAIDTEDFTITYNDDSNFEGTVPYFGSVTLAQSKTSRSNSFEVKIPISITYLWGTITDEALVSVTGASGEAKER